MIVENKNNSVDVKYITIMIKNDGDGSIIVLGSYPWDSLSKLDCDKLKTHIANSSANIGGENKEV